jgi:hypothetical protein
MTAEQVFQLHSEGFNRALKQQDYGSLERIYSDEYMLVRPDGSVLNKQQVLRDLREQGLTFHSIDLKDPRVRVLGSAGILTAESRTVTSRNERIFASSPYMPRRVRQSALSIFRARCSAKKRLQGDVSRSRTLKRMPCARGERTWQLTGNDRSLASGWNCRLCVEVAASSRTKPRRALYFFGPMDQKFSPTSVQNGPFFGWILVG